MEDSRYLLHIDQFVACDILGTTGFAIGNNSQHACVGHRMGLQVEPKRFLARKLLRKLGVIH